MRNDSEILCSVTNIKMGDLEKEIEIADQWGHLVNGNTEGAEPVTCAVPIPGEEIYLIRNVFTDEECNALIAEAEKHGFGKTNYRKEYRGNLRLINVDQTLSNALWERIRPHLPQRVTEDIKFRGNYKGTQVYEAIGLNDHWRLAKYYPGDQFQSHVDVYYADRNAKSMFTVNIYMNGGFEGGETEFHLSKKTETNHYSVVPEAGLALVFRQPHAQRYLHEGKELKSGIKYLFRTDVMYRPVNGTMHPMYYAG